MTDRLKDIATINRQSLPASTDPEYEFDYLEISNVNYFGIADKSAISRARFEDAPSRARRIVSRGSTVISSVRPNLQAVAFFPESVSDFICSTGFNVVEPRERHLWPAFAYYWLISDGVRQSLEAAATGVGYPAVSDKEFSSLQVSYPGIEEQKRISAYLDASSQAIDAAVIAKQKQIDVLSGFFKVTLQRVITEGIDEAMPFRETGNAWLPRVPSGWDLAMLKRNSSIQGGLTLGKDYEGLLVELPYLRVANVQDGFLDLKQVTTIEVPERAAAGVSLRVGDVLMTEGGDLDKLGRGVVWQGEIANCLHQNHIFAVRCFEWKLRPQFLAYVSASQYGRDYFEATGKRTTNLAATNSTKVGQFPIPLPSVEEQDRLIAFLNEEADKLNRGKAVLEQQISTLTDYRKSLIHECIVGQRRITDEDVNRVSAYAAKRTDA